MSEFNILDELVKIVVRGFYTEEYAVVIDGLLREKRRVRDDELAIKLKLTPKLVRKVLTDLRTDALLKSQEIKIEAVKPGDRGSTQTFWFIDYKSFIDVVKYKFYRIRQRMEEEKSTKVDVQQYRCKGCEKVFSALEITADLINMETGALVCDVCNSNLSEDSNKETLSETTKHHSDLLSRLKKIVDCLRKIENTITQIPLFARDIAENPSGNLQSFTINAGNQGINIQKSSAFASNTQVQSQAQKVITNENIEILVDIYDSDNIDEINKIEVKKDPKKTGLATLPPWLLPSNSILNKSKTKSSPFGEKPKEPVKQQEIIIKKEIFDPNLYEEYIKSHYLEWDASSQNKKLKLLAHHNSTTIDNNGDQMDTQQDQQEIETEEHDHYAHENVMVKVGDDYIPIVDITEAHQEKMSAKEYEDFHTQLYDYASKNISIEI